MRSISAFFIILVFAVLAFAQNEQAPVTEKRFDYKDWSYKNVNGEGEVNLRKFAADKKLVMVVYWAPWCPNWRHDVAFVQQLHEKYEKDGLAVIGVAEYDPVDSMKRHIDFYKLTFPNVYESQQRTDRDKSVHYSQRREAGDTRRWGTPWYVFLEPEKLEQKGKTLAANVNVVNGELIKDEAETFIREKLGLDKKADNEQAKTNGVIEACDPQTGRLALQKPAD
ncbi:MAG: TlpA family protein disulfide reductase [Acidobacteria bacterium]|nr:TlpA family protein disulfide reductase [Acidobacteriota bacterium]